MKTGIFYFSGTGNSIFVAKELAKRIDKTELVPIPFFLQKNNFYYNADRIGFVFPCHFGYMPLIVEIFLERLEIPNVIYTFAIITRGGGKGYTLKDLSKRLKDKNIKLDYGVSFRMQMTYIPAFYYNLIFFNKKNETKNEKNVYKKIEKISHNVNQGIAKIEWSNPIECGIEKTVNMNVLTVNRNKLDKYFTTSKACTACATCEKICPVNNISLIDGKPQWQHNCMFCMGCIQFCPSQSINYRNCTQGKQRFHNKNISVCDMQKQKYG